MIFYFSGTGNTRWVATQLAKKIDEQLIFIPDVINTDCRFTLKEGERIGFVFPVHGWRPPRLVRQFVKKLTIEPIDKSNPPYIYILCTAGDFIGNTAEIMEKDLKKSGLPVSAAFSMIMPESYVGLPFMDVDCRSREEEKFEENLPEIFCNARYVKEQLPLWPQKRKDECSLDKGPFPWFFSGPLGAFFVHALVTDRPFRVVDKRCTGCGACVKACPVHNMKMITKKGNDTERPKWLHTGSCLTCFACYHHCPNHAIEYGLRTLSKGQYYFGRRKNDLQNININKR